MWDGQSVVRDQRLGIDLSLSLFVASDGDAVWLTVRENNGLGYGNQHFAEASIWGLRTVRNMYMGDYPSVFGMTCDATAKLVLVSFSEDLPLLSSRRISLDIGAFKDSRSITGTGWFAIDNRSDPIEAADTHS